MEITRKDVEKRMMEAIKKGSITPDQAEEARKKFKKTGVLSILEVLEESNNSKTIPAGENHQIKAQYKWAMEQVRELKRFGNFSETFFEDKPTRELLQTRKL